MSNKTAKLYKGVLENAGLGEVSFYLKKVEQNLGYAMYALDNTNFKDVSAQSRKVADKLKALKNTILELDQEIEDLTTALIFEVEKSDETEGG